MTSLPERQAVVRPLLYGRIRLFLGGQAELLGALIDAEQEREYKLLEQLKGTRPIEPAAAAASRERLVHLVNVRKDITTGLLDDRMEFLNIRVYRGGQADTLREMVLEAQDHLLDSLGRAREEGLPEESEQVAVIRDNLHRLADFQRKLAVLMIDLAGPDTDPR